MPHIPWFILQSTRWALDLLISERDRRKEFIRVYGRDRGILEFCPSPESTRARERIREIQKAAHHFDLTFREVALAAGIP